MEPEVANHKSLEINIKTRRNVSNASQQLVIHSSIVSYKEKVQEVKSRLVSQGIPQQFLQSENWVIVVELICHPGCQKQVVSLINQTHYDDKNQPSSLLNKIREMRIFHEIQIESHEAIGKVFVKFTLPEKFIRRRLLKNLMQIDSFDDIYLRIVLEGQKVEKKKGQAINFQTAEFSLKTTATRNLGQWIKQLLMIRYIKKQWPFLYLLPELTGGKINLTVPSLQKMDSIFKISWCEFYSVLYPQKIVQNQCKVYFGYQDKWISESTIKVNNPSILLQQLEKNISDRYN